MNIFEQKTAKMNNNHFSCLLCDFICYKNSDFLLHLDTRKHQKRRFLNENNIKTPKNNEYKCNNCNKIYKNRNGLWYHQKICNKSIVTLKDEKIEQIDLLEIVKKKMTLLWK